MKYFVDTPELLYPFSVGGKTTHVNISDILVRFRIIEEVRNDPFSTYTYLVKDGERPDTVADNYYGNPDFAWLVMFSNFFFDFQKDWPLQENEFYSLLDKKYTDMNAVHHYEDGDGDIIDLETFISVADPNKKAVTNFDFEFNANENRRNIKLISKKYAIPIATELRDYLEKIKESRSLSIASDINA